MSALIDLDRMKARLAELDAEREPLLALIRAGEVYEQVVGRTLFESKSVTIRQRAKPESAGRPAPILAATETAVAEILELLGPVQSGPLADLLADKPELNLSASNRSNILSARLSNSTRFETKRGVGWWFKDRPWPNENGEPNGDAADSPETGEAPTSPIENRPSLSLVG